MNMLIYPISLASLFTTVIAETHTPNVLFISVDDLNEDIGCLGGPARTPNIDRLAAEGVVFTDAHCNVPVCNASRASLMTGRAASEIGVYENNVNFRNVSGGTDLVTIPQYFRQNGYRAEAAGKVFHHGRNTSDQPDPWSDPVSWDFQYRNKMGVPAPKIPLDQMWHKGTLTAAYFSTAYDFRPIQIASEETYDWQNAGYCANFLTEKHDKPFFLACGIFKPHLPFIVPSKYFDLYPLSEIELPSSYLKGDLDDLGPEGIRWAHKANMHEYIEEFGVWKNFVQGYLAAVTFADDCLGQLLDALEKSPYGDNTIVVLFGDNGFHLGSKEHWEKFTFWNRSSHVPLIIYRPGMKAGVCNRTVSLIDLYPTLVDLCRLPAQQGLSGTSLAPLLANPLLEWTRPVHQYYLGPGNEAFVTGKWRYIHYKTGEEELYDREKDPNDWVNLAADPEKKNILEQFRRQLSCKP